MSVEATMIPHPTLLLSAFFAWFNTGIFVYVAWRLRQRSVASEGARLAWQLFILWWVGLAATTLVAGILNLLGALGLTSLPFQITMTHINLLFVCVALWGLLYYLIYLFTGSNRPLIPLTAFYVAYYGLLVYYITISAPVGVTVQRWNTTIVYREQITGPFFLLVLFLLVVPQIGAGLIYFSLYFKVRDATQRYRILLVSWSIILWFGSSLAASLTGLSQHEGWQLISRMISLAATLTILMAYLPPVRLKQRYGLYSIGEEPGYARDIQRKFIS
jgi:hypothetical protein